MKTALINLRDQYHRYIENINWHKEHNSSYITKEEIKTLDQRISDFRNIIYELNNLIKKA